LVFGRDVGLYRPRDGLSRKALPNCSALRPGAHDPCVLAKARGFTFPKSALIDALEDDVPDSTAGTALSTSARNNNVRAHSQRRLRLASSGTPLAVRRMRLLASVQFRVSIAPPAMTANSGEAAVCPVRFLSKLGGNHKLGRQDSTIRKWDVSDMVRAEL